MTVMAHILILYGTTHGQTAKIARYLALLLRTIPCHVDVADAASSPPTPDGYDAVIVAASVHAQGYQRAVRRWVRRHVKVLNTKPTALVSVCLGVLQQDAAVQREVGAIPMRFADRHGWHPLTIKVVAGALPYTRYNPLTRWIMRRIVARAGGDTDTSRDYEYTDWADLKLFATAFAQLVSRADENTPAAWSKMRARHCEPATRAERAGEAARPSTPLGRPEQSRRARESVCGSPRGAAPRVRHVGKELSCSALPHLT